MDETLSESFEQPGEKKMEGSVRDRFRLIYLKSTGTDKPTLNDPVLSPDSRGYGPIACSPDHGTAESFSSRARLHQAKSDLKHPDPKLRLMAMQFLETLDASVALPLLQEVISDRDPDVRARIVDVLIKLGSPDIRSLLRRYLKDNSPKVKLAALRGMFRSGEGVDHNILLQLLSDESPWVRRKMATLLGWGQTEGAFPILAELARDADAKVRKAALFSLVSLYPEESEDRLLKAMADPDPDLRKWARKTLVRMVEAPLGRGIPRNQQEKPGSLKP